MIGQKDACKATSCCVRILAGGVGANQARLAGMEIRFNVEISPRAVLITSGLGIGIHPVRIAHRLGWFDRVIHVVIISIVVNRRWLSPIGILYPMKFFKIHSFHKLNF